MKKVTQVNHRIEVFTEGPWFKDKGSELYNKYMKDAAYEAIEQIKRHIDNIDDCVFIYDTEATCEHCGHLWTEDSDTYNGGCCAEDDKNQPIEYCTVNNVEKGKCPLHNLQCSYPSCIELRNNHDTTSL